MCLLRLLYLCIAEYLLSLALDAMPRCVGRVLSSDISRRDKVMQIIETLMMNGAVLVPYPCSQCCCCCCCESNVVLSCRIVLTWSCYHCAVTMASVNSVISCLGFLMLN